ncbi:MAG: S1C family serine protease [Treponema sp.]|nr:S1C family serine protease [Treponema sp.]
MVEKKRLVACAFTVLVAAFVVSCQTQATAERRLTAPLSVPEIRLNDIARYVSDDPAQALHLLEVYEIIYGSSSVTPPASDPDVRQRLDLMREEAVANLKTSQTAAIAENRWEDAASLARSLSRVGIAVESAGDEPHLLLKYARTQLDEGNNLQAFLAAARAHGLSPLTLEDARLFMERAVEVRQRRTAAFFLGIIEKMPGNRTAGIAAEHLTFARGRDTAADMIRGVATVWVDRGMRIQRGMGIPDIAVGSAFFIDASGLLITNYHVIASEVDPAFRGRSRLFVRMGDASSPRVPARVIGWDKAMDLALIQTSLTPQFVYSVVDWAQPMVGDPVQAIGSPLGLEKTVTQGIVSAVGRRFLQIGDVIQIDAAVNQGNSGGPVMDMSGRLVGVVFAGIPQFQGLNFAVPAQRLAAALPAMLAGGMAQRPWLGFALSETFTGGAEIIYVAPFTPAAEQQIQQGSRIKSINGEAVKAPQGSLIPALQDRLFPLRPGELVSLELEEPDGTVVERTIRLAQRPIIPMATAAHVDTRERIVAPLFGIILAPHPGTGFSPTFLVKRVVRGSVADEAGISEDDPLSIRGFQIFEDDGVALLDINIRKRRMGYMPAMMRLPALLDTPDTL